MRPGGGHEKGAEFERRTGKELSFWLTDGARGDIFSRNVLSGGSFTLAKAAGRDTARMAGDLMAASPLAFQFLSRFMIECKHLASLGLEQYIYDWQGKSPLAQIVSFAAGQAEQAGVDFMVIAKQNRRDALVITDARVGNRILAADASSARHRPQPFHHFLHRRRIFVMRFDEMIAKTSPSTIL